jgi:hypothetical protein
VPLTNNQSAESTQDFASDFYSGYSPYQLFDGAGKTQTTAGWQDNNSGNIVGKFIGRYFQGNQKCIRTMRLWTGQYYGGWRAIPKGIVVEGSNDCTPDGTGLLSTVGTWTKIPIVAITGGTLTNGDEATLDAVTGAGTAANATLTLGGTTVYKAVRLRFTTSAWSDNWAEVREWEMDEVLQPKDYFLKNSTKTTIAASQATALGGVSYFSAPTLVDGVLTDTSVQCFYAGTAVGSGFGIDMLVPIDLAMLRVYHNVGGATVYFNVDYSDNNSTWTNAGSFSAPGGGVWSGLTLTTSVGKHRYWRCVLNTVQASNSAWLAELEIYEGTVLSNALVVNSAITLTPDTETGAAVLMAQNLVIDGGSLTASTNCKGLIGFIEGQFVMMNGATMHMNSKGKAGNFGDLTAYDLTPTALKRKLNRTKLGKYVVRGEGAAGGAAVTLNGSAVGNGNAGSAGGSMQTGGGGTGASNSGTTYQVMLNAAGKGGPCCGGAGSGGWSTSGAATDVSAGPYGGPGGPGYGTAAGGAGDPVGTGSSGSGLGQGGGLLMLFAKAISIASGCTVSSDGAGSAGAGISHGVGGPAGGGCVALVSGPGGYANTGTVRANGGASAAAANGQTSGTGGAGSTNIFQDAV